jgi:hypothetical protein
MKIKRNIIQGQIQIITKKITTAITITTLEDIIEEEDV